MYIIYGTGRIAEEFLFGHSDLIPEIECCIDEFRTGVFHNIPIFKLDKIEKMKNRMIIVASIWDTYLEIKVSLEKLGLKEFNDFIWSQVFGRKIVLVNANCHGEAVINYLKQSKVFCEKYEFYPLPPIYINVKKEIPIELLQNTDLYIHQDIRPDNSISYKLSDEYVLSKLKKECRKITIPNFVGMAEWMFPELGGLDKVINARQGIQYVLYRDKVLDEAFESKEIFSLEDYKKFWIEYLYDPDFLNRKFKENIEKLKKRENYWDVKVVGFIINNFKKIPCFVDANHPSKYLMREIGRQIAYILNLEDIDDKKYESRLGIPIPIMPIIQRYFKMDFSVPRERKEDYFGRPVADELCDYVKAYMWWYHEIVLTN